MIIIWFITYTFSERKSWQGGITRILSVDNLAWLLRIVLNNHKYFTLILITGELIVLFIVLHVIVYEWCYMYRANTTSWTDVRHDLVSQQVKLHLRSLSRLFFSFHYLNSQCAVYAIKKVHPFSDSNGPLTMTRTTLFWHILAVCGIFNSWTRIFKS